MGTEPVWPPPSPPCTSTASTPHSSTFSAWRLAPIDGITSTPPSCSCPISASLGAWAKLATFTSRRSSSLMRSSMSAASARRFTPNGFVGALLHLARSRVRSWPKSMVALARMPEPAGRRGRGGEPGARDPAHAGLHDRVLDAEQVAEAGVQAGRASARAPPGRACPCGSRPARSPRALPRSGARRLRHVAVDGELEAGGRDDLVDGHAGVHADAGACGGRAPPKSSTPRLVTTRRSSWCSFTQSPSSAARS